MTELLVAVEAWLTGLGPWAYVVAPLVMALVSVLPVPAEAPAMVNGMIFGAVAGSVVTWIGAMLGAWVSYELAHRWGRALAYRMVHADALRRLEETADHAGWWGLLVLRFVPVVAFTALNWGAGFLDIPRWRFLWTTAVGIVPGVILFTTSGVGMGALWRRSPPLAVAMALAVLVLAVVWDRRRKAAKASR